MYSFIFNSDIISRNYTTYIFGLTVKLGLTVLPNGQFNSALRFGIMVNSIQPSGFLLFGLLDSALRTHLKQEGHKITSDDIIAGNGRAKA